MHVVALKGVNDFLTGDEMHWHNGNISNWYLVEMRVLCLMVLFVTFFHFLGKQWNAKMQLCGMRQDIKSGIDAGGTKQYHRCDVKSTNRGMFSSEPPGTSKNSTLKWAISTFFHIQHFQPSNRII